MMLQILEPRNRIGSHYFAWRVERESQSHSGIEVLHRLLIVPTG